MFENIINPDIISSRFDFFLVSQSVRQGTVSPTSYHVIFDDTGFKAEHFQRLTYKLTHLYFNWQVSTSFGTSRALLVTLIADLG